MQLKNIVSFPFVCVSAAFWIKQMAKTMGGNAGNTKDTFTVGGFKDSSVMEANPSIHSDNTIYWKLKRNI